MARKQLSKIPKQTKKIEVVPQDLKDKWGSITAISTAATCLDKGAYPHSYASAVRNSIAYLAKLHETLVDDALKHPQAHMIQELNDIKKEAAKHGKEALAGDIESDGSEIVHPTPGPECGEQAHT